MDTPIITMFTSNPQLYNYVQINPSNQDSDILVYTVLGMASQYQTCDIQIHKHTLYITSQVY